jgi:rhamnopyranosyl-N-acetylglucosaminyl-diphospho-decaprenol beta-1,3/1,4-galactofuranosyltransferase
VQDKGLTVKRESICAVVVTFNRKALLEECLTALLNQTRRLDEIIVIDNASTDGTEALFETQFLDVTRVRLPENIGGAGGFHEGMKLAYEKGYNWIWVMDDDAVPMADALEELWKSPVTLRDDVYAVASAVFNRDSTISLEHRRLFDAKAMAETIIGASKYEQDYFEMDTASFVGLLISHKAIEQIGLPLEEMFIFFDDTEYSLRIRERGIMATVPASKIVHGHQTESPRNMPQRQLFKWEWYYEPRNRIYTYRKYGKQRLRYFLRESGATLRHAGGILIFGTAKCYSMKGLLCGTLDGMRGKLGKNYHFLPG